MKKNVQRINESQLRAIVAESVKKVLNEIQYDGAGGEPSYDSVDMGISDEPTPRSKRLPYEIFSKSYSYLSNANDSITKARKDLNKDMFEIQEDTNLYKTYNVLKKAYDLVQEAENVIFSYRKENDMLR